MDATASGSARPGVNVTALAVVVSAALLGASPAGAQTPGTASYRVLQHGAPIGTLDVSIARNPGGWSLRSAGVTHGTIGVDVKRFEAQYSPDWQGRLLSVERTGPRSSTLMHVVVGPATAHVDIVTAREARWHSHSTSPDTVFLPEHAYGAFAAVAARLAAAGQRAELPLLFVPDSERRASVDAWEATSVATGSGPIRAERHTLTVIGIVPEQFHVWEAGGDLLRVDIPGEGISIVRTDLR